MVKIRLKRMGRKKRPFYRIVVADVRTPRDGRSIEEIGYYNPLMDPPDVKLDLDKVDYWIGNGAKPTKTVSGIIEKQREIQKQQALDEQSEDIQKADEAVLDTEESTNPEEMASDFVQEADSLVAASAEE